MTVKPCRRSNFLSLLLFLIFRLGDEHSAIFLIKHSCLLDHQTNIGRETPLHLLAGLNPSTTSSKIMTGMCRVAQVILEFGADTKKKDSQGNNCLHRAILSNNLQVFRELLKAPRLELDDRNKDDHVPLWLALQQAEQMRKFIFYGILRCGCEASKRFYQRVNRTVSQITCPS